MNRHIVSAAIIILSLIYVPWNQTFQRPSVSKVTSPAGYGWVFSPPKPPKTNALFGIELAVDRWAIQVVAALVAAGAIAVTGRRRSTPPAPVRSNDDSRSPHHAE
jgi:hypothetical protein